MKKCLLVHVLAIPFLPVLKSEEMIKFTLMDSKLSVLVPWFSYSIAWYTNWTFNLMVDLKESIKLWIFCYLVFTFCF